MRDEIARIIYDRTLLPHFADWQQWDELPESGRESVRTIADRVLAKFAPPPDIVEACAKWLMKHHGSVFWAPMEVWKRESTDLLQSIGYTALKLENERLREEVARLDKTKDALYIQTLNLREELGEDLSDDMAHSEGGA